MKRSNLFWLTVVLLSALAAPSGARAGLECSAQSSRTAQLMCSHPGLDIYDKDLNAIYSSLVRAAGNKGELQVEQRKWVTDVRNRCKSSQCLIKAYIDRSDALSERLVFKGKIVEAPLSKEQANKTCLALAKLADDDQLADLAVQGRRQYDFAREGIDSEWGVTAKEEDAIREQSPVQNAQPEFVYRVRLRNKPESSRFAGFSVGGTCAATQVFNVALLLQGERDDSGVDEVDDPEDELRWVYSGGGDYPIVFNGRNFIVTADLRNPNSVRMISWIKPNGRTLPLCLLSVASRRRMPVSSSERSMCSGIADGSIQPLKWRNVTEDLPLDHDSKAYPGEFARRYGQYAHKVESLKADLQSDGHSVSLARFTYESSAGCGSESRWLTIIADDLSRTESSTLNGVLGRFSRGPLDVYQYKGTNYVHASETDSVDDVIALRGTEIEHVCEFRWKTETTLKRLFNPRE